MSSTSFFYRYRFYLFLAIALVVNWLPLISIPFNWLETYFHELSHGLAAIVTGGKVVSIQLYLNGAGLCTTIGGSSFLISLMGYVGAALWGACIYLVASAKQKHAHWLNTFLIAILMLSVALWVRDLLTLVIVLLLAALFYFKRYLAANYVAILYQFTGIVVCLNAVLSPLHLLDGRHIGDGAALANMTMLPEIIWVVLWSSFGIGVLYLLRKKS